MKVMLTRGGYDVLFAEDGKAAVERAVAEKPDLVLMDGLLPKLHGFLACKAIKEQPDPPKVLLVTGVYTKPTYKWEAKRLYQADDIVIKPLNITVLLDTISKHLPHSALEGCAPIPYAQVDEAETENSGDHIEQPVSTGFAFRPVEADEMINSLRLAGER